MTTTQRRRHDDNVDDVDDTMTTTRWQLRRRRQQQQHDNDYNDDDEDDNYTTTTTWRQHDDDDTMTTTMTTMTTQQQQRHDDNYSDDDNNNMTMTTTTMTGTATTQRRRHDDNTMMATRWQLRRRQQQHDNDYNDNDEDGNNCLSPCHYRAKCYINRKTIQCLSNISQHVPIYFQQFPSYSNRKCKKSSFFAYRSPHFCQITLTSCFPLETPLRLSRNMLHRWKDNSMLAKPLAACTPIYLQQFPSYSNRKCKKSSFLRTPAFILCFPWGRPWCNHAKCCMDGKRIRCLQIVSQHVPIYLPSYSNRKFKKSPFSRTAAHIFRFPWRRRCDYHAICCMDGKTIQCLPNHSQYVPIYLQ